MPRPEVFLSHSSADKESVKAIAHQLNERAIPTWLDEWDLAPGDTWADELGKGLRRCSGCIVFVGRGGAGPWHREEVRSALDIAVRDPSYRLVPVLLPGASRRHLRRLPLFLTNRTWVEFSKGLDDPDAIRQLVRGLRRLARGFGCAYALHHHVSLPKTLEGGGGARGLVLANPHDFVATLQRHPPSVVFHGHRHLSYDGSIEGTDVHVVAAPSTTLGQKPEGETDLGFQIHALSTSAGGVLECVRDGEACVTPLSELG